MVNNREIRGMLVRRLPIIVIAAFVCAALVYAYLSLPEKTTYSCKSSIIPIPNQSGNIANNAAMTDTSKAMVYLLNTKNMVDSIRQELNITADNAYQELTVAQADNNPVIEVTATGASPEPLQKMVDGIVAKAGQKAPLFNATLTVLESGTAEQVKPEPKNAARNAALAFLAGAIIASCLILLRNYFNNSIKNESEVMEYTGLPVVARLPETRKDDLEKALPDMPAAYREQVGKIAFYAENGEESRTTVGVSAVHCRQGKPIAAFRLAEYLACKGESTLLLVLDPDAQNGAGTFWQNRHSLSDLLRSGADIGSLAMEAEGHCGLKVVLATGLPSLYDINTLASLNAFIERVKEKFRFVVLALPATDVAPGLVFHSGLADRSFLVAEAFRTNSGFVVEAATMARSAGAPVAGFILTQSV